MADKVSGRISRALGSRSLRRIVLCLVLLVPGASLRAGAHDPTWIFTSGTAAALGRFEPLAVKQVLASSTTIELGAGRALSWASEEAFAEALHQDDIPSGLRYLMYAPQSWDETP